MSMLETIKMVMVLLMKKTEVVVLLTKMGAKVMKAKV